MCDVRWSWGSYTPNPRAAELQLCARMNDELRQGRREVERRRAVHLTEMGYEAPKSVGLAPHVKRYWTTWMDREAFMRELFPMRNRTK